MLLIRDRDVAQLVACCFWIAESGSSTLPIPTLFYLVVVLNSTIFDITFKYSKPKRFMFIHLEGIVVGGESQYDAFSNMTIINSRCR